MTPAIKIEDHVIWFTHLRSPALVERLNNLEPDQELTLETDGVVGQWQRMKTGPKGQRTLGIRPVGTMKSIWNDWFKARKGETIEIREVKLADDYLASVSVLYSEWAGEEDEEAFRDL